MTDVTLDEEKTSKAQGRAHSKEVRRHQLIDATVESIAKHGISGATMKTVSGFAGLSLRIVNFHFDSKENLFEETLRFPAEEHRDAWQKITTNASMESESQLMAIVDAQFIPNVCNPKKLTVWFAFSGEAGYCRTYSQIMGDMNSERWRTSHDFCRQMAAEGNYTEVDPDNVAKTLEGLLDGICLNKLIYPDDFTRESGKRQIHAYLATKSPKHLICPKPQRTIDAPRSPL